MNNQLNRQSSTSAKKDTADAVFHYLTDYFFNKVVFINLIYSDLGGGGTTSTTIYGKLSRIIDTSEGYLMAPSRESRIRSSFYLKNPSKVDGYILSPVLYDALSLPTDVITMSIFRSYVGLKFSSGNVYAVVKEAGKSEKITLLDFTLGMVDATYTKTYALEMRYNVSTTEILINGVSYWSYSSDLVGSFNKTWTFFPFFAPARSKDGTSVNIVAENIQFIQNIQ